MANFLPPAIIEIKALADKAIAEFKEVNQELGKMEKEADKAGAGISGMEKSSKIATGVLLGLGAAFAGFAAIGIKEAMEAETALNKLGSTMSAVGVNTTANRDKILKLTSSYVDLGFSGDTAVAGFEKLLRVTGDVDESQRLLALSADLARTKNIGLSDAAGILSKASMGNAKAFKEMGITLDTTLPKSEAVAKAMTELNDKIGTQAENATKTFAVQLQIVKERFNDTAESLGGVLLPMIKDLLEKLNKGIEFVKRNSEVFKTLAGIFLTVAVALASYNAAIKIQMALTKAWSIITGIQVVVTKLLTGQQLALNGAMKLNPIGLVVSAVVLLIGGLVMLWNKSEAFRKMVITAAKAALTGFASIIPMVGKVYEVIMKVVTGPLRALLTVLSKLPGVGKYAKAGLDIMNKGLDGISDFADKASKKATELAGNLDKLNKPIKIGGDKGLGIPNLGNEGKGKKGKGALTPEEIKAAKEKAKEIKKENEEAMKLVASLNKKIEEAKSKFADKMLDIEKDYNEKTTKLRSDAAEKIVKLDKDFGENKLKLEQDTAKKITAAQTKFNDTMASLNKKKGEDLAKSALDNQNKVAEITKAGQDKLQSIIQQGIDRLRSAFKQGTQFSVGDLFKGLVESGDTSATSLLKMLQTKLGATRLLAQNASRLASLGFTQTFIEQVVSQGPEIGNQLSASILNATPETVSQLQSTFNSLEDTSESALDRLGATFNDGVSFATADLANAYYESTQTTKMALEEQVKNFADTQAEIIKTFNDAMGEAEKERDETIAELNKSLIEALAELQKNYNESLADINKDLANSLAETFKDMVEAQNEARKALADTLADIEKEFQEKLSNIENYTKKTINAIKALQTAMASVSTMTTTPVVTSTYIPPASVPPAYVPPAYVPPASVTTTTPTPSKPNIYGGADRNYDNKPTVVVNAPVTNYNTTSNEDIGNAIVRISKYGLSVR